MKDYTLFVVTLIFIPLSVAITDGAECPKGEKKLHNNEECIPVSLFNYLYCLEKSGSGRIEITRNSAKDNRNNLEVTLEGKGSGVVIKGSGAGKVTTSNSNKAALEIHEKLDPTLAKNCAQYINIPKSKSIIIKTKPSRSAGINKSNLKPTRNMHSIVPPEWSLLEEISFTEMPYQWHVGNFSIAGIPKFEAMIVGGKYRWVIEFNERMAAFASLPYSVALDFYAAIDVRIVEPTSDPIIAFLFGGDVRSKTYAFKVSPKGIYSLIRLDENGSKSLLDWTAFNVDMNQSSRLAVLVNGQIITLYVNNKQIGQYRDTAYTGGQLGLQVGGSHGRMVVDFDNFEYRAHTKYD